MSSLKLVKYEDLPISFYEEQSDSLFYSHDWIQVLQKTYGFAFYTAYNEDNQHFLIFAKIEVYGQAQIISLPFSDYVKVKTIRPKSDSELLNFIRKKFPQIPIRFKVGYQVEGKFGFGAVSKRAYYHRINLDTFQAVQKRQKSSFRNKVRQAEKQDVRIQKSHSFDSILNFYELYRKLRFGKFGIIPQPFKFFENIFELFVRKNKGFILEATYHGEIISCFYILEFNNVLYHKFSASSKKYLHLRPNNLLIQKMLEIGLEQKNEAVDLGLSGVDKAYEGLVKFKESTGAERQHISTIEANSEFISNEIKATKDTMGKITQVMVDQEMDLETTDKLSEIIYPYFA